jgi:hypothetical protein
VTEKLIVFVAPLYVVQIVLVISGTSATAYAFMMFFANFASVICVAFATSAYLPNFLSPRLN